MVVFQDIDRHKKMRYFLIDLALFKLKGLNSPNLQFAQVEGHTPLEKIEAQFPV